MGLAEPVGGGGEAWGLPCLPSSHDDRIEEQGCEVPPVPFGSVSWGVPGLGLLRSRRPSSVRTARPYPPPQTPLPDPDSLLPGPSERRKAPNIPTRKHPPQRAPLTRQMAHNRLSGAASAPPPTGSSSRLPPRAPAPPHIHTPCRVHGTRPGEGVVSGVSAQAGWSHQQKFKQ